MHSNPSVLPLLHEHCCLLVPTHMVTSLRMPTLRGPGEVKLMRAVISSVGLLGRLRCLCMSVRAGPWKCAIAQLASTADEVWRPIVRCVVLSHDWFRTRGGVGAQR